MCPYSPRRSLLSFLTPLLVISVAFVMTGCLAPAWYPGGYGRGYGYGYGYGGCQYGCGGSGYGYGYVNPRPYGVYYGDGDRYYRGHDDDRDDHHHGGGWSGNGWSGNGDHGSYYGNDDGDHHRQSSGGGHVRGQPQQPYRGPSNEQIAEQNRQRQQQQAAAAEEARVHAQQRQDVIRDHAQRGLPMRPAMRRQLEEASE